MINLEKCLVSQTNASVVVSRDKSRYDVPERGKSDLPLYQGLSLLNETVFDSGTSIKYWM